MTARSDRVGRYAAALAALRRLARHSPARVVSVVALAEALGLPSEPHRAHARLRSWLTGHEVPIGETVAALWREAGAVRAPHGGGGNRPRS